jgi:hypothetical protein
VSHQAEETTTSATLPSILEGDEGNTMPNNEIRDDSNSEADVATLMHDTQDESYRSDYVEVDGMCGFRIPVSNSL